MFKCVIQEDIKNLSSVSQGHKQKVTLINTAILFNLKPSATASMQNHIENHHPFPDESSSGNVGMSFSCDLMDCTRYWYCLKKHMENQENKHKKANFYMVVQTGLFWSTWWDSSTQNTK